MSREERAIRLFVYTVLAIVIAIGISAVPLTRMWERQACEGTAAVMELPWQYVKVSPGNWVCFVEIDGRWYPADSIVVEGR